MTRLHAQVEWLDGDALGAEVMGLTALTHRKIGPPQQRLERSRPVLLDPEQHADEMGSGHRGLEYCRPRDGRSGPRGTDRALRRCGRRTRVALLKRRFDPEGALERSPDGVADHGPKAAALELIERLGRRSTRRGHHVAKLGHVLATLERELRAPLHGVEYELPCDVAGKSEM